MFSQHGDDDRRRRARQLNRDDLPNGDASASLVDKAESCLERSCVREFARKRASRRAWRDATPSMRLSAVPSRRDAVPTPEASNAGNVNNVPIARGAPARSAKPMGTPSNVRVYRIRGLHPSVSLSA